LLINGNRELQAPAPGRFAAIRRAWRSGDRIELELPLLRRLESVDAVHPDTVALLGGPLVLMRILENGDGQTSAVTRDALLAAQPDASATHTWQVGTGSGRFRLKPFLDITGESYSAYQDVSSS
jgi:hypothetical protein